MSYALPTVRVVNPARAGSYITINRDDFGAAHELWPEQEEGFTPIPEPRPVFDPAERDLAVEILNRMVPAHLGISSEEWAATPGPARLDLMRTFEMDTHGASVEYGNDPHGGRTIAKANGPRGLWYVMWGDQRVSQGFRTEAEAQSERARMAV